MNKVTKESYELLIAELDKIDFAKLEKHVFVAFLESMNLLNQYHTLHCNGFLKDYDKEVGLCEYDGTVTQLKIFNVIISMLGELAKSPGKLDSEN